MDFFSKNKFCSAISRKKLSLKVVSSSVLEKITQNRMPHGLLRYAEMEDAHCKVGEAARHRDGM